MAALPQELDFEPVAPIAQPARPVAPRVIPNHRDLRVASAPKRRAARYVMLMAAMAALGVFGCVSLNALAAEQAFAVRELEADVAELTRTADELTVEVTRLESPARLHREAVRTLGMVRADQPAFVVLPRGGSTNSKDPSRTMAASATDG